MAGEGNILALMKSTANGWELSFTGTAILVCCSYYFASISVFNFAVAHYLSLEGPVGDWAGFVQEAATDFFIGMRLLYVFIKMVTALYVSCQVKFGLFCMWMIVGEKFHWLVIGWYQLG